MVALHVVFLPQLLTFALTVSRHRLSSAHVMDQKEPQHFKQRPQLMMALHVVFLPRLLTFALTVPQHLLILDPVTVVHELPVTSQRPRSMVARSVLIQRRLLLPVKIAELLGLISVLAADLKGPQHSIQKLL